ncbi:MAG: M48 family metalloprotease, partial [Phycisphaerae bacterium]|nr:M48 family metalloprotease [Phycisphaerae bacterium]
HVQKGRDTQLATLISGAVIGAGVGYAVGSGDDRLGAAMLGAGVGTVGGRFINMGFTRKDEEEADRYGFRFYTRAGWDPDRFDDFFQTMIDKGYDKTPEILSDHPSLRSRVAKARQWAAQLPSEASQWRRPPVADERRFSQLKQRAATVGRNMPTDRTLENSQRLLQALPRSCISPIPAFEDQVAAQKQLTDRSGKK